MTEEVTLQLTDMAHGGAAIGRDKNGRLIFVPYALPGEKVKVRIVTNKGKYARATLIEVLKPSPQRLEPRCPHFTICGGCHFQHIPYERQLQIKEEVVQDQLKRIGQLKRVNVQPTLAYPGDPWRYGYDVSFSPVKEGGLGFWSPVQRRVMPIETCHIIQQTLLDLFHDVDLELPGLRKLTLRLGADEELLAALEVDQVEPPQLETDLPVSVAIVLPDKTAASLVGGVYLVQAVKGRDFRVSPGCFFYSSPAAAAQLIEVVLAYAQLTGQERIIDAYSGVGILTAFLADTAAAVVGIEVNPDAVADTAVNLYHMENVTIYQGMVEEIVPALDVTPDLAVVSPPEAGLSAAASKAVLAQAPARIIYISQDIATLARDGKHLTRAGYRLQEIQPIDMMPQTFQVDTVSLWVQKG